METNFIACKATQLVTLVAANMLAGENVCIEGAPGTGKSQLVGLAVRTAFARRPIETPVAVTFPDDVGPAPYNALPIATATPAVQRAMLPPTESDLLVTWPDVDCDYLILHPVVTDPTDWRGLPVMTVNGATFSVYGDVRLMLIATRPLVVFLDDLAHAPQSVQAAVMQLIENRAINGVRISDHVRFVAATNRRSDKGSGANILLDPLQKRCLMLTLVPDLLEWQQWGAANGISPKVIAYLSLKPEYFLQEVESTAAGLLACPRGWHRASRQLALNHPTDCLPMAFAGCVGKEAGGGFAGFLRIFDSMVLPETVFADPERAPIPNDTDATWALVSALAYRVTNPTVKAYMRYLERLAVRRREHVMLSLKVMASRDPTLQTGADYIAAMAGPLGKLMLGAN